MINWREGRLILIFIILMMAFFGTMVAIQFDAYGTVAPLIAGLLKPAVSPVPSPVTTPAVLGQRTFVPVNHAFPSEVAPENPINPFK